MTTTLKIKDNFEGFTSTVEEYVLCIIDKEEKLTAGIKNIHECSGRLIGNDGDYEYNYQDGGSWSEGGEETLWLLRFPNDSSNEFRFRNAVVLITKSLSGLKKYLENRYDSVRFDIEYQNCSEDKDTPFYVIYVRTSFRYKKINRNSLIAAIRKRDEQIAAEEARNRAEEEAVLTRKREEEALKRAEEEAELARLRDIENRKYDNYKQFKNFVNEIGDFRLPYNGWNYFIRDLFKWNDEECSYEYCFNPSLGVYPAGRDGASSQESAESDSNCQFRAYNFFEGTDGELATHKNDIFSRLLALGVREPQGCS